MDPKSRCKAAVPRRVHSGVDRLLEEPWRTDRRHSGTSAGAMNGAAAGGSKAARIALKFSKCASAEICFELFDTSNAQDSWRRVLQATPRQRESHHRRIPARWPMEYCPVRSTAHKRL